MKGASRLPPWGKGGKRAWASHLPVLLILLMTASASTAQPTALRVLDRFDDLSAWQVSASDDVQARLRPVEGPSGRAMCLDFDFGAVSGYAVARRPLALEYGENYEFSFRMRGDAPPNTLQFKLLDASGENVWWVDRPNFAFPRDWQRVRFKARHISFAWGPTPDRRLQRSAAIEFVVARGTGGGSGSVCFDELTLRTLPPMSPAPLPRAEASSTLEGTSAAFAVDGVRETAWRSDPAQGRVQSLTLDFGRLREFGGLVVHWLPKLHATRYTIEYSDDGVAWHAVRHVSAGNGNSDPHLLTESETRYVRLRMHDGPGSGYGIAEIEIKALAWGASPNAFFEALARTARRGDYPRAYIGEQPYWTVLGIDGGRVQGLLSEDGALEWAPQSPSVEPFLVEDGKVVTWSDAKIEQALLDDRLPLPSVRWQSANLTLAITAYAATTANGSQLVSQYVVANASDRPRTVRLALAIRPFQVNPPTQFLNEPGGVARIERLAWDGKAVAVNGTPRIFPLVQPNEVILAPFEAGSVPELVMPARPGAPREVRDETGFASGALRYTLDIPAHGARRVALVAPLEGAPEIPDGDAAAWLDHTQSRMAHYWRERLDHMRLQFRASAQPIADTLGTALAQVLASRAGPALRPGTRAYARSWIRDGAMMADALSRLGHAAVARDYIEWFAPHQFANGKVPCCVDRRGADPVAENDSHGAFIYLVAQHYRYGASVEWLRGLWPRVAAAAEYMNRLRREERSPRNKTPGREAFYGLMPPSISHEGYSDKPAYSYWDDFWTLAGYDGAIDIARALGRTADADRLMRERNEFRDDLEASIRKSMAQHGIRYIPGSADRGDYDPTSTTIALSIAGFQSRLPHLALEQTFGRYWTEFVNRRAARTWDSYTPYEWRNVGAVVRLGQRERVAPLAAFLLDGRRPARWNQWAEVVGRAPRAPRFVGDMPHGWVASDYISAVLDLFAYERATDDALVIAAGVPEEWLDSGVGVANLRTLHGSLSYTLRAQGARLALDIAAGVTPPAGGLVFLWPYAEAPGCAAIDGRPVQWEGRALRIRALPAQVRIERTGVAPDARR